MSFDLQHFEFGVSPSILTKALTVYRKGSWVRLPMTDKRYQFSVAEQIVSFQRERKKISELYCTCGKAPSCLHSVVALLAIENVPLDVLPETTKASANAGAKKLTREYNSLQRQLRKGKVALELPKLKSLSFATLLAYYLQLSAISDHREEVVQWQKKTEEECLRRHKSGLTPEEIQTLIAASRLSLRSDISRKANTWSFLIPLMIHFPVPATILKEMEVYFSGRSLNFFHHAGADYRAIGLTQIQFAFSWPDKKKYKELDSPELLAMSHFYITSGEYRKGIKLLINHLQKKRLEKRMPEPSLISYAIEQSLLAKDEDSEAVFIEEQMRWALQVDPALLERLRDLRGSAAYLKIVAQLALETPEDWLEKKKDLLLAAGDRSALQVFLRQPLRFNSLIQVLQAILPVIPSRTTSLLVQAIPAALQESPRKEWQEHILSQCQPYLLKLPALQRQEIVRKVAAGMGERSHISDWFNEMV